MQKAVFEIEASLKALEGCTVRVQGRRFSADGRTFSFVKDFVLPNGFRCGSLPVFFEGVLRSFERRIGVFLVELGERPIDESASDGIFAFRGELSVIVKGPVIVELEFPFYVERLPKDAENYWRDLRLPIAQLEFPMD